jgi:hypothetical protein
MTQPVWITPAGSLGTIPENEFYQIGLTATAESQDVLFRLIAGRLPDGIQITSSGMIEGIPKNVVSVQGIPQEVSEDVTSRFAVRAYTTRTVGSTQIVDRIADRTFEITVTGQSVPEFVTPAGSLGAFYDGSEVTLEIQFTDSDPDDDVRATVLFGELPPGLVLDPGSGIISGIIEPLVGPPGTARPGYDATAFSEYPFDFATRSASKNYQFAIEISDGKDSNVRTFEIFVFSRDSMTADTDDFTADNTFITADVTPTRTPLLVTPEGDLGRTRADNFYAFRFEAIDFDGDAVEYSITVGAGIGYDSATVNGDPGSFDLDGEGFDRGSFSLPPGLLLDADTGWLYGYIPDQGATEATYRFAIRVRKRDNPTIISPFYYFTLTITGNVETEVLWLTDPDLGVINNGAVSHLAVEAINVGGRSLQYALVSGDDSRLPQGLTLQSSGHITGRVSFNTFALDGGTTTFDKEIRSRSSGVETTFDSKFEFTVNAFAAQTEEIGYEITNILITDGGSGYSSQPTVTISAPPETEGSIQATAGVATIVDGVITNIAIGNPGRGYTSAPSISISGGGGNGATAIVQIREANLINAVSVFRRFTVTVNRAFNTPYESLYVKCMPPAADRALVDQLVLNQDIIPNNLIYRADDPNFGVAKNVTYVHAYGLAPAALPDYVNSLDLNHYWKNLVLGPIRVAQARDSNNNIIYEVVYSEIVDDLVNNSGESVGKSVELAYPVLSSDGSSEISTVYPNSLINMRDQVVDEIGQISPALPLWMTSKQADGRVLGYRPAWVIAYVLPGQGDRIAYNIRTRSDNNLNVIDFEVDRYILDRSQTRNWDPDNDSWIPSPAAATTFDFTATPTISQTIFDGGATSFVAPADRWESTDQYDKYLIFPKRTILG